MPELSYEKNFFTEKQFQEKALEAQKRIKRIKKQNFGSDHRSTTNQFPSKKQTKNIKLPKSLYFITNQSRIRNPNLDYEDFKINNFKINNSHNSKESENNNNSNTSDQGNAKTRSWKKMKMNMGFFGKNWIFEELDSNLVKGIVDLDKYTQDYLNFFDSLSIDLQQIFNLSKFVSSIPDALPFSSEPKLN